MRVEKSGMEILFVHGRLKVCKEIKGISLYNSWKREELRLKIIVQSIGCQETMRVRLYLQCYYLIFITTKQFFQKTNEWKTKVANIIFVKEKILITRHIIVHITTFIFTYTNPTWPSLGGYSSITLTSGHSMFLKFSLDSRKTSQIWIGLWFS